MPVNPVDVELMWRTNKKTSAPIGALELKLERGGALPRLSETDFVQGVFGTLN